MRRKVDLLVLGLLLLAVLIGVWSYGRARQARGDLTAARNLANKVQQELTAGEIDRAQAALVPLRRELDRAAGRTGGPMWTLAEHLPLLGSNFHAVRRAALAAQVLGADVLPQATEALSIARRDKPLHNGVVDLAVLARLRVPLHAAALAGERARALVDHREHFLLPSVSDGFLEARAKVDGLAEAMGAADKALGLAPTMLGQDGPRRYYIAVQNNAEARATGGLIGAFALMTADRGKITLAKAGTDSQLHIAKSPVPSDPQAATTWKNLGSTLAWFDANLTPNFPDAARNIAGQWTAQSGDRIDGVIGLDPLVMGELLRATGPISIDAKSQVSAGNVMAFIGHDEYVRYPSSEADLLANSEQRKALLRTLATTLFHRLLTVDQPVRTLQALARAGASGHLFVWSAHPAEEAALKTGLAGGALPRTSAPYLSVLTQNFGGNKLDYYIRRSVDVRRDSRKGFLRITVTLRNIAPEGLPFYMTVRSDKPPHPVPYGQAKVGLSIYGAYSSEITRVTVDGRPGTMTFDRDQGHRMSVMGLEVPRGRPVVVSVLMSEPEGELLYRQQPLVVPDQLEIKMPYRVVGR